MKLSPLEIRIVLEDWVSTYQPHTDGDVMVEEMCFLGRKRRADLVHANGKLSAYEIKSEADTLTRWPGQEEAYLKVFDHVWLCCHTKHISKALTSSSPLTGILLIDDYSNIAVVRHPKKNNSYDIEEVVSLLWRSEIDYLLCKNSLATNAKDRIAQARARLVQSCSKASLKQEIVALLKARYREKSVLKFNQNHLLRQAELQ